MLLSFHSLCIQYIFFNQPNFSLFTKLYFANLPNINPAKHSRYTIPYMAKFLSGKTFTFFVVFQSIAKVFPSNHLLCTVHDGHDLMHHKSFPVNSVCCAQPQKFSHSKVLRYTVCANEIVTCDRACKNCIYLHKLCIFRIRYVFGLCKKLISS